MGDFNSNHVAKMFEDCDRNHNGYIDRQSLTEYVQRNNLPMKTVNDWFTWFDMEQTGRITYQEMCSTLAVSMPKQYKEEVKKKQEQIAIQPKVTEAVHSEPPPPPPTRSSGLFDGVDLLHDSKPDQACLEEIIRLVKANSSDYEVDSELARELKQQLEFSGRYGRHWQTIVGSYTFGCAVGHEENMFVYFRYEHRLYVFYRTPDY